MSNPLHENKYRPIEEIPIRWITERLAPMFPDWVPITDVSIVGLIWQLIGALFILEQKYVIAVPLIVVGFIFDKLDGDLARLRVEKGLKVDLGKGTFIDGFIDILGIIMITLTVCFVYIWKNLDFPGGFDAIFMGLAIAGPILYWYMNAGVCAYLPKPEGNGHNPVFWKQFVSYSKSKEVLMQIIPLALGDLHLYLLLHALIIPYTILVFIKKVKS